MDARVVESVLGNIKGATFVGLDTETVVDLKGGKKNEMQGRVTKVMTGALVQVFARGGEGGGYENKVNRRLDKEGKEVEFEVGPRKWGTRLEGKPFVEHKGELYLEVIFERPGESHYLLDGKPIQAAEIIGLDEGPVKAGEQGGLEDKVILRTFKFDSIKALRVNKTEVKAR